MIETNLSGSYVAIASIIVAAVAHFGFSLDVQNVVDIITGIVAVIGIVHQMSVHVSTVAQANGKM